MNEHKIEKNGPFYLSLSFWSLLIANAIVIIWAVLEEWSLGLMIWVYFCQNIILGFSWAIKVMDSAYDESYGKKLKSVAIFMPQYLFIHVMYAYTLYMFFGKVFVSNYKYILSVAGIFLISEIVSLVAHGGVNRKPMSLAQVQLFPYARIFPMHLFMFLGIVFLGRGEQVYILLFLVLKAVADVGMFVAERSIFFGGMVTYYLGRQLYNEPVMFRPIAAVLEPEAWDKDDKGKRCSFCQKEIRPDEETHAIKDKTVCLGCYRKIEAYKKNKA
ncbi:MAG: DUF6498-containing protein [Phycisphaerae bacterium]|jgi:hypothetical protein